KSSAHGSVLCCHYGLRAPVSNANTPKNKGGKFFGLRVVIFFGGLKVTMTGRIQLQKNNDAQLMK
ncbi:hypothetical protein Goshw_024495, partial [Gossypium schwendimanii]|nr:hypothetical protein [Gossypium schwendimanii]